MSAINCHLLQFYFSIMLVLTVDVCIITAYLWTITGTISSVIVNIYINISVDTNKCYSAATVFFNYVKSMAQTRLLLCAARSLPLLFPI